MSLQNQKICDQYPKAADDNYFHLVEAWQALARQPQRQDSSRELKDPSLPPDGFDINSLELLRRYQTSLDRQLRNTLLNLEQYRKNFAAPPPAPQQNEPKQPPHPPTPTPENRPHESITLLKPAPQPSIYPPSHRSQTNS